MNGNKPIKRFRAGAITASVFENINIVRGSESKIYNVLISKTFKDKEGNWKSSHSFSVFYELPKVILLLNKVYEYVATLSHNNNEGENDKNE
jgi:hypothetical protein